MRWSQPLDEILGSRAKVRLLRALWGAGGEALSGRELGRRTGLSHTGALRALEELGEQDVVWPSGDPTGTRYRLNRTHELVRDGLMPLFSLEASADDRLARYVLERVPGALSVTTFGSVARGADTPRSDLDLLAIVPDGLDAVAAADAIDGVECYARFGKLVMPVAWTLSELAAARADALPLVDAVLREGRTIAGEPVGSLLAMGVGDGAR